MMQLPRIRIEVENMKYQIIHAFSSHNDEIERAVDEELTKAIQNYPFDVQIAKLANEVITEAIKSALQDFFIYGEGRKQIEELLKGIVNK